MLASTGFLSAGYVMRVVVTLALLLSGFYLFAKFGLKRWIGVFSAMGLPGASQPNPLSLKVLSKTRIGPVRDILVVQVDNRRLVLGATAQQITLLAELEPTVAESARKSSAFISAPSHAEVENPWPENLHHEQNQG